MSDASTKHPVPSSDARADNIAPEIHTKKREWGAIAAVWWTLVIFLVPQAALGVIVGSVFDDVPELEAWANDNAVVYNTVVYGVAEALSLGLLALYLRRWRLSLGALFGRAFKSRHVLGVIGAFALYFVFSAVMIAALKTIFPGIDIEQNQTTGFESAISNFELVLTGVSLVILPPLTEEILFRGFLFRGLRSRLPFLGAAFLSSVLFGFAHGQINVAIDTFVLAMVLCWLVERTKSLWPAILLHGVKNALAFALVYIFKL